MKANKINSANILSAFTNFNKSFNAAIRYIYDTAKEVPAKVPAAPGKEDKSAEAKNLRKDIKAAEVKNAMIDDCKRIIDTFNVTANDLKAKSIGALRAKFLARIPNVDEGGHAVKFAKLPAYLKSEVKDYATIFQVAPASWIEAICAAAENEEGKRNEYILTNPPVIEEGVLTCPPTGDIVNASGNVIDSAKIFAVWCREATINNIANAAGREKAQATKKELKAK